MILHRLIRRFLKHRDDAEFYRLQAADSIRWLQQCGVPLHKKLRVLDLGCGHGVFGAELKKMGCQVVFADAANFLKEDLQHEPFLQVDLDAVEWPELGRFDLVICSNVLEHLSRPDAFLRRAPELLTDSGYFFLSWTNWLSPWGGHEFSPWHYLGPRWGPRIQDLLGRPRTHRPGENLFVTYVGHVLREIRKNTQFQILRAAPRYYTAFSWILAVPGLREFLAWNVALLLTGKNTRLQPAIESN